MLATTFEPSTSSIDSDEPRILFWPSDSNGAPHIPISSISPETKVYAGGDDVAGEAQNFVIIGWAEQPLQEVSPNTSINSIHTSSKNVIAIGAIELSIHGGKVANRGDTTNFATMENPQAKELVQKISASIENLAKTNPCLYPLPESDASSSTSNCGKCKTCATFQSLRVLSIVSKVNSMEKENNHDKQSSSKNQIVLYNPQKADDWGYQQCDIYFHSMEYESWEMCLLRISEASKVFKHLIHTMNILSTTSATGDSETKQKVGSRVSGYPRERKKCDTWQKHPDHELSSPTLGDKSMLWTHLATQKANCDQQSILKGCNTTEHSWVEASFGFLIKIPLALIITVIYRRRAATGIKECNIPSKSFIAAILIDSILGLAIGTILMQYPIPIIHYVSSLWKNVHNRLWNDGLHWLESFPAGFKLNVALTHQMGKAVRLGLLYQQSILCYIFQADSILIATETTPNPSIAITVIQYIGLSTAIMGSRFFFAFAFDMTRLGTLHIHYLSSLFSTCQRCELSTLTSLWLLFRGKKRNILRHRSDHLQYDHMQLLLGMIFFTVCLFLFTTILVYHCFFAAMDFLAEMMTCTWWCLFMIVEGGMHLERILMEEKAAMDRGDGWIGRGVRLLNKGPLAGDSLGEIENAFFGHFFGDTDSDRIFADGNPAIIKANLTLQWKMNEDSSSSMEMKNIPHVSLHSSSTSIQEITFPTSSNFKILIKAFASFAISKIKKITCLIEKFLFGKSCRIASSCVELLRRMYCRGSFVERISIETSERELKK